MGLGLCILPVRFHSKFPSGEAVPAANGVGSDDAALADLATRPVGRLFCRRGVKHASIPDRAMAVFACATRKAEGDSQDAACVLWPFAREAAEPGKWPPSSAERRAPGQQSFSLLADSQPCGADTDPFAVTCNRGGAG